MQADYWLHRWEQGQTGWHRQGVMPLLEKYWPVLSVPTGTQVLVPLCGKTLDMLWLAEQGLQVLGVELSSLAIEQFFADNALEPALEQSPDGPCYHAGNIKIIQNDIFELSTDTLASCNAFYDRAAIIAQPEPQRKLYAREIYHRLPVGCRGLIITLDYPQQELSGPPFAVTANELQQLFAESWDINQLEWRNILATQPEFQEDGVTALHTGVYAFKRRS